MNQRRRSNGMGDDALGASAGVERAVRWLLGPDDSADTLGDWEELGRARDSERHIALWYWGQVTRLALGVLVSLPGRALHSLAPVDADLLGDLRFALRGLRRSPLITVAILVTIALGVGANTAIFSVVDAVMIRSLPFPDPERLVLLYETEPPGATLQPFSPPDLEDIGREASTLQSIGGWVQERYALTGDGDPAEVLSVRVSGDFFQVLGADAELGRVFDTGSDQDATTVVLSHGFWVRRFGADPAVVGRSLTLDFNSYEIVGVMPVSFRFPDDDEVALWMPQIWFPWERIRHTRNTSVIARLAQGSSVTQVEDQLGSVAARLGEEYPATNAGWGVAARPASELAGGSRLLLVLLGAVGLVLVIACANAANLLLTRASDRRRELAVRASLGASRWRISRQLLVEAGVMATLGSALGVLLALGLVPVLVSLEPGTLPSWNTVEVNARVLAFASVLAAVVTVAAGFGPALRSGRGDLVVDLAQGSTRAGASRGAMRARSLLSIAQIGLAVVLLSGASLLVASLLNLRQVEPGFDPTDLVTATIELPDTRYEYGTGQMEQAFQGILEAVRGAAGITAAGWVTTLPMNRVGSDYEVDIHLVEHPARSSAERPALAAFRVASAGYFEAMRIPLHSGRTLSDLDRQDSPPVAVVNQTLADRYYPGEDALGQHVQVYGPQGPEFEIVGVIGDVRHRGLDDTPRAELYLPFRQMTHGDMTLVVRSANEIAPTVDVIKASIASIDPDLPLIGVRDVPSLLDDSVAERRYHTMLLVSFAVLGLFLAVVGVYGSLSHWVSRRGHEIGVRLAMGATGRDVVGMVVRQGFGSVAIGIGLGLVGGVLLSRTLESALYDVRPGDPAMMAVVVTVVAVVALFACVGPALRASRVPPATAFREG